MEKAQWVVTSLQTEETNSLGQPLRAVGRRLSFGRAVLKIRQVFRFGLRAEMSALIAKHKYLKKVREFIPLESGSGDLDCFMLLNEPRIYEGMWALYSFRAKFGPARLIVLNDGSLSKSSCIMLRSLFPGIKISKKEEVNKLLDDHFPQEGCERIRSWRNNFVFIQKLIDPVFLKNASKMILLDSDTLHFRKTTELEDWLRNSDIVRYIADVEEFSLCAPPSALRSVGGGNIPRYFCAGYLWLPAGLFTPEKLEQILGDECFERQRQSRQFSHVAEQSIYAIFAGERGASVLPETYATCPDPSTEDVVMGHYCGGDVKRTWFYTKGLPYLFAEFSNFERTTDQ